MSFDLGAMLASVSDSDTGREQIEYIPLVDLQSDPNNFYQLSHLDELADNIATCGLQQPLRVRPDPDGNGKYIIVSGHRRRAAVEILAKENMEKWREIPCIVERDSVSPALQQLRLIYANANTRAMTLPKSASRLSRWKSCCTNSRKKATSSPAECGIMWPKRYRSAPPNWPG